MGWDSNPRYVAVHLISSQAPSTTRTPIQQVFSKTFNIIAQNITAVTDAKSNPIVLFIVAASFFKKVLHYLSTFFTANAADNIYHMIKRRIVHHIEQGLRSTGFAVRAAINQTADPAHHNRTRAHWARFNRHIKSCPC